DGKPMKVVRNVQTNATVSSGVSSGFSDMNRSECAAPIQNVEYHATSSQDEHQHQSNNSNNDQVMQGYTNGIMNNSVNGTKQSFTSIFKATIATKIVLLTEIKNDEVVQVSSEAELKDSLVEAIPFPNRKGHSLETVKTENEWKPPRCDTCKIFDHWDDDCSKRVKVVEPTVPSYVNDNDGFTQVTRKHGKAKQDGKGKQPPKPPAIVSDEGINLVTLYNLFDSLMERDKVLDVDDSILQTKTSCLNVSTNDALEDDDEEVKEVFNEEEPDKKEMFCSFVYAHNRYIQRRKLWQNLLTNKSYIRDRPWCLLRDFNVSLHADEKSTDSLSINTGMRDFQECMDDIEMSDVNSMGLRFTWNQKPKGDNGILKKIDQIIANLAFYTSFVGSSAIFQPYRISDHSSAILRVPMLSLTKPHPFKFSNILVHNTRFKDIVINAWNIFVGGFWMFRVVKRLKLLKHPLRKLLYDHGNLHENVKKLCHELDTILIALDKDPDNIDLREEEAAYLLAFNDA
ncbi:RNA-directed DNA polymerase, eukaryota, reverse transcriptase zinc-binding domain protein, partial [Tanacetum coccineum]